MFLPEAISDELYRQQRGQTTETEQRLTALGYRLLGGRHIPVCWKFPSCVCHSISSAS